MSRRPWVNDSNAVLLTDLYEISMLHAYFEESMEAEAVFDLFARRLPPNRSFLVACGLDDVLDFLEQLSFTPETIEDLERLGLATGAFAEYLRRFRFTGEVHAVLEGTPVFANEPLLQIVAPLPQAQIVESFLMNQIHVQTLAASKAARVVMAAAGRPVADFGLRRMHGADAAMKAARAFFIAGVSATSNVLGALVWDLPLSGTMAHSYVQAHDTELEAFRQFVHVHPETVLLVDTYDTLDGVRNVVRLARELGDRFRVRAIRLDSGDLLQLAKDARRMLDEAGLERVEIVASSGLDEHAIARLVEGGAPIAAFGVGTHMGVSADAPYLDLAYKLSAYAGRGRVKLSSEKSNLPGRKQVYRRIEQGEAVGDVIATSEEPAARSEPLLIPVMENGRRTAAGNDDLRRARERCRSRIAELPARLRRIGSAGGSEYPVALSEALRSETERLRQRAANASRGTA